MTDIVSPAGTTGVRHKDMGDGSHAEVVAIVDGGSVASDGALLNIDSLAQTLVYNADNTLNYIQVVDGASTYRQTYTYTSGLLTAVSKWVKQ